MRGPLLRATAQWCVALGSLLLTSTSSAQSQDSPAPEHVVHVHQRDLLEDPPPPEEDIEDPFAGYKKGFYIQGNDDSYRLKIGFMSQVRFEWLEQEESRNQASFFLKRFRFRFAGNAFSPRFRYFFQPAYDSGVVKLLDWWVDFAVIPGKLQIRMGRQRVAFTRQFIMPVWRAELVDRSNVDKAFTAGRDMGFELHNQYEGAPPFEWAVGLFNGGGVATTTTGTVLVDPATGEGEITNVKTSNVPAHFHPLVAARVGVNTGGMKGYHEGDLEGGPFRFAAGIAGLVDIDSDRDGNGEMKGTADVMMKLHGFSAQAVASIAFDSGADVDGQPVLNRTGLLGELSYTIAHRVQPIFRWGTVFYENAINEHVLVGGVAVYILGHKVKWQNDYTARVSDDDGSLSDQRFRSQAQFIF